MKHSNGARIKSYTAIRQPSNRGARFGSRSFIAIVVLALRRDHQTLPLIAATMLPMIALCATVVAVSGWEPIVFEGLAPRLLTHLLAPTFYAASVSLLDGMPNERL